MFGEFEPIESVTLPGPTAAAIDARPRVPPESPASFTVYERLVDTRLLRRGAVVRGGVAPALAAFMAIVAVTIATAIPALITLLRIEPPPPSRELSAAVVGADGAARLAAVGSAEPALLPVEAQRRPEEVTPAAVATKPHTAPIKRRPPTSPTVPPANPY